MNPTNAMPRTAMPWSYFNRFGTLFKAAVKSFRRHKAPRLGAALAFYTLLSLSPLLLIVLSILESVFGTDAARGSLTGQIEGLVGTEGAHAIESMIANANQPSKGWIATAVGLVILLFGASGVFVELKEALDTIWETPPDASPGLGLLSLVFDRLLAFGAISGVAFLLLVSLLFSAVLTAVGDRLARVTSLEAFYASLVNAVVSFLMITGLFAMIFKFLPTQRPPWANVWFGAVVTAVLFMVGKSLIGLYLGRAAVGSAYGAAGSLVVLLVWIYYSTQILLLGVEITRASVMAGLPAGGATAVSPKAI